MATIGPLRHDGRAHNVQGVLVLQEAWVHIWEWLDGRPVLQTLTACGLLALLAWLLDWLVQRILLRGLKPLLQNFSDYYRDHPGVIAHLAHVVPAVAVWHAVGLIPGLPEAGVQLVRNVCSGVIVLMLALAISAALDLVNFVYQRRRGDHALRHPIKGYLQVLKIVVYAVATILVIASLLDRSPLILLSGLGAMAAVLMLIFQDTLLSLVASVQIASNDIVRVGDWVEMPQLNADGAVMDIALHTVKVQNWDKTVTSIPTRRFITDPFKNWRGMQESGGRRIKRSLYLDQQSVKFLDQAAVDHLNQFAILQDYLAAKQQEIADANRDLVARGLAPLNSRRLTNLGSFRAYVECYLRRHPGIHQDMILMVRQMAPGADGLPLEIYCFTNSVLWTRYEGVQSDVFDHLLAILPEFELRVFQHPSGADLRARAWGEAARGAASS